MNCLIKLPRTRPLPKGRGRLRQQEIVVVFKMKRKAMFFNPQPRGGTQWQ